MHHNQKILIKDPYLNTTNKSQFPQRRNYISAPKGPQIKEYAAESKWKIEQDMKEQLQRTRNQFKRLARAYTHQNKLNRKILDYQALNNQYHQALKFRNLDLNNKLSSLTTQQYMMANKLEEDANKNFYQKDVFLKKFQNQSDQLLQAKKTINNLLQQKVKLQQEIQHLLFTLEKQTDRFSLQMREQILRMEGLQRNLKNVTQIKNQEISQLRNRLKIYEDQNKRLNQENKSLSLANISQKQKQNNKHLDNLSQINYLDSNMKSQKQDDDKRFGRQLTEQKIINERLQKQIDGLKSKLFQINNQQKINNKGNNGNFNSNQKNNQKNYEQINMNQKNYKSTNINQVDLQNVQGLVNSVNTLRNGIDKQIFEVFYKSVKDGQKNRSNSLLIFIQNWKLLDLERIAPYIKSYFQSRDVLKQICLSSKFKGKQINERIQQCIPLSVALKKGRNQINLWILSTIQFTKNQRQGGKKSMNNQLLFLFRLLTIQYRINYPMQGKSYTIDADVRNQLYHQIVKAIIYIIDFR